LHSQLVLSGGSFDPDSASAQGQYRWGKNVFGASASGSMTSHYLSPWFRKTTPTRARLEAADKAEVQGKDLK
jgi:hypothetical protein